jgi:hypothetical protein
MKPNLILLMLWLVCGICPAATLSVALDGTMQYTVIQEAINASADTDTVLVYPGRYYENIRFNGKNITLASLELTTGNLDYKYSTILDGNQNGSVIQMGNNETNATIRGFTVTNGSGTYANTYDTTVGGGINISRLSSQRICNIINCLVYDNNADLGGGIRVSAGNLTLSGVSIYNNSGASGGGVVFQGSTGGTQYNITFDLMNRCSIYNNKAALGSDMYFYMVNQVHVVVDTFTVASPSNFYAAAIPANSNIQNPYTFDILHSVHEEVNHDLYVAPWGDDNNSGLSEGDPLKTIFKAVFDIASDPVNPKTIHLADGVYSKSNNQQYFPIPMKNYTKIQGSSRDKVYLDMESNAIGISSSPYSSDLVMKNLSIVNSKSGISTNRATNISIDNIDIKSVNNIGLAGGYVGNKSNSQLLSNVMISDVFGSESSYGIDITSFSDMINLSCIEICNLNTSSFQRALNISSLGTGVVKINGCTIHSSICNNAEVYNTVVQIAPLNGDSNYQLQIDISDSAFYSNNQANSNSMGMLHALNDTVLVSNCTFAGNAGGSSALVLKGDAVLTNNIFWNPQLQSELVAYYSTSEGINGRFEFVSNCIRNGLGGIYNMSPLNQIIWGEGNTSTDPMFAGEGNHPYRLSSGSPLIDAGWQTGFSEPTYDAGGNERFWDGDGDGLAQIDIGAYEYQPIFSPSNLTAVLWQQQIELSWEMPAMDRALSGYRVYRNNLAIGEVSNPGCLNYRDYSVVNDTLTYYVVALYGGVESSASNSVTVIVEGVANTDETLSPAAHILSISPNPFADLAVIHYNLSNPTRVQMQVYNLKGQLVRTLVDASQSKGEQLAVWEGCDDNGRHLASGIYFLRTKLEGKTCITRRLVLLR